MKNFIFAITLLMLTTGCATVRTKKPTTSPTPTETVKEVSVTLTPAELSQLFRIQDDRFNQQLEELRKSFADVEKRIIKLKAEIAKQVKDCLCPAEMK